MGEMGRGGRRRPDSLAEIAKIAEKDRGYIVISDRMIISV